MSPSSSLAFICHGSHAPGEFSNNNWCVLPMGDGAIGVFHCLVEPVVGPTNESDCVGMHRGLIFRYSIFPVVKM